MHTQEERGIKLQAIQIYLNDTEYKDILDRTRAGEWPSIAECIKSEVFPQNVFVTWYSVLKARAASAVPGSAFSVSSIMGDDWDRIPKPTRLALGRAFSRSVEEGIFPDIVCTDPSSSQPRQYRKAHITNS
jgi:hypothetical protein